MSGEERNVESPEQVSTLPIRYGDESSGEVLGSIQIEKGVVSTITSLAAADVDGIVGLVGKFSFGDMLGRKDVDKGVLVAIEGNRATINVEVTVEYGVNIYDVCHRLQRKVKDSVEEMTGLVVEMVNVNVRGIAVPSREGREQPRMQTT